MFACSRFPPMLQPAAQLKSPVAELASKLQLRLQEFINRHVGKAQRKGGVVPLAASLVKLVIFDCAES